MNNKLSDFYWDPNSGSFQRISRRGKWTIRFPKPPPVSPKPSKSLVTGVAVVGFAAGYLGGQKAIYSDLASLTPRDWVVDAFDALPGSVEGFLRKTVNRWQNNSPTSSGGREIQSAEYSFKGGQNPNVTYLVSGSVKLRNGQNQYYSYANPYNFSNIPIPGKILGVFLTGGVFTHTYTGIFVRYIDSSGQTREVLVSPFGQHLPYHSYLEVMVLQYILC